MGKKKTKIVSNRGYATSSAPSKKVDPPATKLVPEPVVEAPETPEQPFEDITVPQVVPASQEVGDEREDLVVKMAEKFRSLNEFKVDNTLEKISKEDPTIPTERVEKFRMSASIERKLLQAIQSNHSQGGHKTIGKSSKYLSALFLEHPSPIVIKGDTEKERIIGQFDVTFGVLSRLGFDAQDILNSFKDTISYSIDTCLDWVSELY